jgi:hypothetical protein
MRNIYNLSALIERYGISAADLEGYISKSLLVPRGWMFKNDTEQARMIADEFSYAEWEAEELERFDDIVRLIHKNYNLFYTKLGLDLTRIELAVRDIADNVNDKNNQIIFLLSTLSDKIDLQESWLSLNTFCDITGYKIQTCYNNIKPIDGDIPTMCLDLEFYDKLIWYKRGKSWQTKYRDFKDIRKFFTYELRLVERKRTGEFKPPVKFSLDDLK